MYMTQLPKSYIAKDHEKHIYEMWLKNDAFKPNKTGKSFSILMPPPNANESLHVGHALMVTVEDLMVRHARMNGASANWIPGTDHAGFETQVVYEKKLQKENKSRFDFTPQELRENIRSYVLEQQNTILSQIKLLGASCDWDSLYFTLDKNIIDVAYETFSKLHDDKLLYRAKRLVNYCVKHGTSFSDLEVEYEEKQGSLVYIKYPLKNEPDKFIVVATTRPETMLGDSAVAVSPNGKDKELIGKAAIIPLINREIPIIADEAVVDDFGSGCVKVTPAHSHIDSEIASRHKLLSIEVIDLRGKMIGDIPTELVGLKTAEARKIIVEKLTLLNLIEKEEDINHRVGVCYKCKTPIEILPIEQWWVSTKPLAQKAIKAIKENAIEITPKESKKNLITWLENIIDWNISRQIVWGIPIPAWYKDDEIKIQAASPGAGWEQDKDTFDTWFSSTQLPFAALGYPNNRIYKDHYPTSVMETGADILYFWVARMIMMSLYVTGEIPFKEIYLHGLVLDAHGKKMSKSKGNVVDPLTIMDQYGTDALRWAVVHGTTAGQNFNMTTDRVIGGRNFANKIWNASRYVISVLQEAGGRDQQGSIKNDSSIENCLPSVALAEDGKLKTENSKNKDVLDKLSKLVTDINKAFDTKQYGFATDLIFDFFWHEFCDKYLEESKTLLKDPRIAPETQNTLLSILITTLKLLHPFMPFVTETIWQELAKENLVDDKMLILSKWPNI